MQITDDIIFESRDVEIFNIPDTKTKLNTLQNYFFPRLQRLLDMALLLVREIYKLTRWRSTHLFTALPTEKMPNLMPIIVKYTLVFQGVGMQKSS